MKKSFKTVISFLTVTMLILSFSSCSLFENMQNAANNKPEIFDTPDEAAVIAEFNKMIAASFDKADKVTENVSYSAGKPEVLNAQGEEAGILDAAANQLKSFIMSGNPGSESKEITNADGTLLSGIDAEKVVNFEFNRNIASENVTNEKGENVNEKTTNETGEEVEVAVTREYISDNTLHLTVNYFEKLPVSELPSEEKTSEALTEEDILNEDEIFAEEDILSDEDLYAEEVITEEETTLEETTAEETTAEETTLAEGETEETTEEETTVLYADDSVIESVFGGLKNKEDVLKNFDCISEYIKVIDYTTENAECKITSDADLGEGTVSFVRFEQNMKVIAKAQGVGDLESYGDIEIVFTLTKTTSYDFTYAVEEAELQEDSTAAEEAEQTTSKEVASEETTEEIVTTETVEDTLTEEIITDEETLSQE